VGTDSARNVERAAEPSPPPRRGPLAATPAHAAILALQRSAGNSAVARALLQRVVQKRKDKDDIRRWVFYSSLDPAKVFDTEAEAARHDAELAAQPAAPFSALERPPTLYTYTLAKPYAMLGSAKQGPHTVAHRNVAQALAGTTTVEQLRTMFSEQVATPAAVDEVLKQEKPSEGRLADHFERFRYDYGARHAAMAAALQSKAPDLDRLRRDLGALLAMDPYATYGWKSGKKVGAKALKGKGEGSSEGVSFDPNARFNNPAAYATFLEKREKGITGAKRGREDEPAAAAAAASSSAIVEEEEIDAEAEGEAEPRRGGEQKRARVATEDDGAAPDGGEEDDGEV
jgi:hypothetical protein